MTGSRRSAPDRSRSRVTLILSFLALLSVAVAIGSIWFQRSVSEPPALSGQVLPDFSADMPQVRTITIASSSGSFSLTRAGSKWVIPERDNYPVLPQAMSVLAKELADLAFVSARTSDPTQFARLGVGDPSDASDGYLIAIKGATGQILRRFHIGQKSETTFVRMADSNDVFEVRGKVSKLGALSAWLDMAVLDVLPENIASVSGGSNAQTAYAIVRRPDGGFAPVGGQANSSATATALALTKWAPVDVKASGALTSDPLATHATTLRDGMIISVTAYRQTDGLWVVISADTLSGQVTPDVSNLNQRTDGWAYRLDSADFALFTLPRDTILTGASGAAP